MSITVNSDPDRRIKDIRCFVLDMDGTVYLGEQWIEGALEFLEEVRNSGRKFCFMTNNSSKNASVYIEKLHRMGLDIDPHQLVTSGHATIAYLLKHYPGKKVFLLGNSMLRKEFETGGIILEEDKPDIVVTAFDTMLDYAKLCQVCDFVRHGLPYLATHPDYNCPTETGFIPDIGAIHAFIHASTGRMPDRIIGKPNSEIVEYTLAKAGCTANEAAVVGDRLYTDIAAGINSGLTSIFVLSGEAQLCDLAESPVQPHLVFDSVKKLIPYL